MYQQLTEQLGFVFNDNPLTWAQQTGLIPLELPALSLFSAPILPPFNPTQTHSQVRTSNLQVLPLKRKRAPSDLEIPDSEGEDDSYF